MTFRAMRGMGSILAFEPTPAVFNQVKRNVPANGCESATCIQTAVSDKAAGTKSYMAEGEPLQRACATRRAVTSECKSAD